MGSHNIAEDVRRTGTAFRDWLTPYYTLGGAVAFFIAVFTLLDPSGQMVRIVSVGLFLATVAAWVFYLARRTPPSSSDSAAPPAVKLHAILLAITIFFLLGMLVSEALMRSRNIGTGSDSTLANSDKRTETTELAAPTKPGPAPVTVTSNKTAVPAPPKASNLPGSEPTRANDTPVTSAEVRPGTSTDEAPLAATIPPQSKPAELDAHKASSNAQRASPKQKTEPKQDLRQAKTAVTSSQPQREDTRASDTTNLTNEATQQRCSSLLSKFSLGEELRPQEKRMLETSCR